MTTSASPSACPPAAGDGSAIGSGDGTSNRPVGGFQVGLAFASGVADGTGVALGEGLGLGVGEAVGDGVGTVLADGDGLAPGEAAAFALGEAAGSSDGDGEAPGDGDALGPGDGDAPGPGEADGSGCGVAVGASRRIGSHRRPTCAPAGIEAALPDASGIVSSVFVAAIGSDPRVSVPNLIAALVRVGTGGGPTIAFVVVPESRPTAPDLRSPAVPPRETSER
jgi:hypothetical protein